MGSGCVHTVHVDASEQAAHLAGHVWQLPRVVLPNSPVGQYAWQVVPIKKGKLVGYARHGVQVLASLGLVQVPHSSAQGVQ